MSIEFSLTSDPPLANDVLLRVKQDIIEKCNCELVRDAGAQFGLCFFDHNSGRSMNEEISVSLESHKVYVAFHVGNKQQRASFLVCCEAVLASHNLAGKFEEL